MNLITFLSTLLLAVVCGVIAYVMGRKIGEEYGEGRKTIDEYAQFEKTERLERELAEKSKILRILRRLIGNIDNMGIKSIIAKKGGEFYYVEIGVEQESAITVEDYETIRKWLKEEGKWSS